VGNGRYENGLAHFNQPLATIKTYRQSVVATRKKFQTANSNLPELSLISIWLNGNKIGFPLAHKVQIYISLFPILSFCPISPVGFLLSYSFSLSLFTRMKTESMVK